MLRYSGSVFHLIGLSSFRGPAQTIREFNLREGMKPGEDFLPEHFFKHPLGKNRLVLKDEEFTRLVRDYYELRGYHTAEEK